MKLSDYVFEFLRGKGVDTIFYLPGGGCMHLLDSLGASGIGAVSLLHEQAVAIAAEGYANAAEKPGCALVTTGPGGTNAVTGVLAAYLDSSPVFFLSGQVKTADLKSRFGVRGHGSQEADIVSIVSTITKYADMVVDKADIRRVLEHAWSEMTSGRRGPVWVDIPLDIQCAQIEPAELAGYSPAADGAAVDVSPIIDAINAAKRPVIIAGNGLIGCKPGFYDLLETLSVPVIPTWKAMDYIPNGHPLYAGRGGGMGDRPGNFAMQNADLLLCLGARLDFSITGYDRSEWSRGSRKIVVDIDPAEIKKLNGAPGIIPVIADAREVIDEILRRKREITPNDHAEWKARISYWKKRYPITAPKDRLTTYALIQEISAQLPEGAYIAPCSAGTTAEIFFQAFTVKSGQRIRSSHGLGAMGFELPGAIGMCLAGGREEVVCVAGDGGVQLNIQELAVISGRKLPIKVFVVNNGGYASIRNMQNTHFDGRQMGSGAESGLYLPDLARLSGAYGLAYRKIDRLEDLRAAVRDVLTSEGGVICEVAVNGDCLVTPRTAAVVLPDGTMKSSALENQFPFLSEDEVKENMRV